MSCSSTMPFVAWISGTRKVLTVAPCVPFGTDCWSRNPMELSRYSHGRWNTFVGCGRSATGRLRMLSKWLFGSMISRSTPRGKIYLAATTYYIRPPPNFEGYPSWLVCPLLPIEVAEDFELIVIIGTGCRVFIVLRVRCVSVGRQAMDGCLRVTDKQQ